ncbi:MAG: peptidoglycan editing factor PgeF [Candidatus Gastranaerophilales bacterium]|nr:peptidoglycan editing factor PgeF [Candidatus Gastranaerophilales bacterium]
MFYFETKQFMKSDIFDNSILSHVFTTRKDNKNPYGFSMSSKDFGNTDTKFILQNRKAACDYLQVDFDKLLIPEQKHTANIAVIAQDTQQPYDLSDTDGVITNITGLPVMLLFADCIGLILFDPVKNVMGIIHAGWRGSAERIAQKAGLIFVEQFNSNPADIKVAIGAGISQSCFEVSEDIARQLNMTIEGDYANIFSRTADGIKVDLKMINAIQLNKIGIKNIDICNFCTSCGVNTFYSYRKENGKTGRHAILGCLKEKN